MSYPKALKGDPKVIFFTDFDGTITLSDTNDFLTDNFGFGEARRRQLNLDCLNGKTDFRDTFQEMLDSITTPMPECIEALRKHIKLDPYFKEFYSWARANNIPVVILSGGMTPIIRALLVELVGPEAEDIDVICNECADRPGKASDQPGGWTIKFHDDSGFGHDKSLTIRPYAKHFDERPGEPRPTMLYAGDGVSDLSAARETDLLFAKKGRDLVTFCEREKVPFTVFEDWSSILETTKDIFYGRKSLHNIAVEGLHKSHE